MKTRKQNHNALIRARAQSAIEDLYHNATVTYPRDLRGRTDDYFQDWFNSAAEQEIDYLQHGGRTLAPDTLYSERGRAKVDPAELSIPACVALIRIVESFNRIVGAWCKGVPELWREHCDYEDSETLAAKRKASAQKARETRERNAWACRGMVTS